MGKTDSRRHTAIRQYKNKITREFVMEGKQEFLFPNSFPPKYFWDLKNIYKRVGILITKKEDVMQGTIFEMELIE